MIETAIEAARTAGAILMRYFETTDLERIKKPDATVVTRADKEAEAAIVALLEERYPDHGILGEEGTLVHPDAEYQWIIDPLDGTSNFVSGIPLFSVSIALAHHKEVILGVVYSPLTNSLYAAERGKGTTYNGTSIHVSSQLPEDGTLTIGPGKEERMRARQLFANAYHHIKSVRMFASSALELAYIARGGTEAYICLGLPAWDYAAGTLLVTEAGGMVTGHGGEPWTLDQNYFIASNGHCHDAIKALLERVP